MRLLVVIPAYNEEANIVRVVEELKAICPGVDYVVVNDGSRDRTAEICRERGYRMLDLPTNLGLAGAFQAGLKLADRLGYDYAIQLDGDGQHDPAYIQGMLETMEREQADVVIGSRFVSGRKPLAMRMLGSNIIQLAIRLTTGQTIHDPTSGMRMFNRTMIHEFAGNLNYGPEPDTVSYLMRNGARVAEFPVRMRERVAGKSYLSAGRSVEYMLRMCLSILLIQPFRRRVRS